MISTFLDRLEHLSKLKEILDPDRTSSALVIIMGVSGVGKTRLVEYASRRTPSKGYVPVDATDASGYLAPTLYARLQQAIDVLAVEHGFVPFDAYLRDHA